MRKCLLLGIIVSMLLLGCNSAEEDPKQSSLRHIDVALEHVTDISVPDDDFMTRVFRVTIETRLKQAQEYLKADDYANAIERLELVKSDARDPIALGGSTIAEHCQDAIRLIKSIR